jgi:hypothetical protein
VYSSGAPSRTGGQDDGIDLDRDVGRRGQYEGVARSGVDRRAVVEPHFRVEDGVLKPRDAYRRDAAASGAQQRERQRMGVRARQLDILEAGDERLCLGRALWSRRGAPLFARSSAVLERPSIGRATALVLVSMKEG